MLLLALLLAASHAQDLDARCPAAPSADGEEAEAARRAAASKAARLIGRVAAGEPTIEEVQRAAARLAAPPREAAASWARRARLAGLVPRLTVDYRHDERSFHVAGLSSSGEVDYARSSPGDTAGVRLTWDLGALVFAPEEIRAAATEEGLERRRREAVERATRLYFERRRLQLSLAGSPPSAALERVALELNLDALTAELDALTGGILGGRGR